mgnify:CR=1 FL=1
MRKFLSNVLIVAGMVLLIMASYMIYLRYSPKKLAFAQTPEVVVSHQSVTPVRLIIPAADIDTPIIPNKIENNKWPTSNDGILYLSTSSTPGEQGNSVFYGHNWSGILGNLPQVIPGNEIRIKMSDGSTQEFIVEYTDVVEPTLTAIINQTSDSRITIYTCTGFFDSKRFVVVAK